MIDRARGAIVRNLQHRDQRQRAIALGVVATLAYIAVRDPHRPGSLLPPCPTKLITGLDCPACGGLRLTYDVMHGDVGAALHDNPFLLAAAPVLGLLLVRDAQQRRTGQRSPVPPKLAYSLAGAAALWTIVRNLRGWPLKPLMR